MHTPAKIDLEQLVIVAFMVSGALTSVKGQISSSLYVNVHADPTYGLLISQNQKHQAETPRRLMTKQEITALRGVLVSRQKNGPIERLLTAIGEALRE